MTGREFLNQAGDSGKLISGEGVGDDQDSAVGPLVVEESNGEAFLNDVEDVSICNISPSVINRAVHILETSKVRTLDPLHIACALELEADEFISSDIQQLFSR